MTSGPYWIVARGLHLPPACDVASDMAREGRAEGFFGLIQEDKSGIWSPDCNSISQLNETYL